MYFDILLIKKHNKKLVVIIKKHYKGFDAKFLFNLNNTTKIAMVEDCWYLKMQKNTRDLLLYLSQHWLQIYISSNYGALICAQS